MVTLERKEVEDRSAGIIREPHCKRCSNPIPSRILFSYETFKDAISVGCCERCYQSIFDEGQDSE